MNPRTDAIPLIEASAIAYRVSWKNTSRISEDWKVKIYEQAGTGRQLAIYDRKTTLIRLEHMIDGIIGVQALPKCPASDGLKVSYSHFSDNMGICVSVDSIEALTQLLAKYFSEPKSHPAPEPRLESEFESEGESNVVQTLAELSERFEFELSAAKARTRSDRLARLAKAPVKPRKVAVQTNAFVRNADVVAVVLDRAKGRCEGCNSPAPFLRSSTGDPYLEVHHVIPLASDGDDTIENAIAMCPNCHRQRHHG